MKRFHGRRLHLLGERTGFAIEQAPSKTLPWSSVTVLEVIQRSTEFLQRKGVDSPRLQIELLLGHVLKIPRLRLYLDFERKLSVEELEGVRQLVKRRAAREPLQQIVGSACFCGYDLKVTPSVLIPRPETEGLAELAWTFLRDQSAHLNREVIALDFGTGSGCIAIALTSQVQTARVWAIDISPEALEVARENALRNRVEDRIEFLASDGFAAVARGTRFDLIVANPPYIPTAEIANLAPEVREHDPRVALDGGPDGLQCYRLLAKEAATFLQAKGRLMCEFGDGQADAIARVITADGWTVERLVPDLSGRLRILIACMVEP